MPTASATATALTFDRLTPSLKRAIRGAVDEGTETVGAGWGGRLHNEAQAVLGTDGSPFASAVYEPQRGTSRTAERFAAPVYVLTDEIIAHLSA